MRQKNHNKHLFALSAIVLCLLLNVSISKAATTIGANISTDGSLTVGGALQFTSGATLDYVLRSDAAGNATWLDLLTLFATSGVTSDDLTEGGTNLYYTDAAVDARITLQKGAPNGLAELNAGGQVLSSQIPALAISNTYVVPDQATRLALAAFVGDVAVQTDISTTFILQAIPASNPASWVVITPPANVISVNGQTNVVSLDATDIGLGTATSPTFTGLTLSGLTPGGMLFAGATGAITEDITKLYWDNATNRLGIGTSSPNYTLDVAGSIKAGANSLVLLGTKTNPDPAGTIGAMYYNTSTDKFRCYENGAWKDCDTGGAGGSTLQQAYDSGATITTAGATDIALTLTSGNFAATGAGSVNLTPAGASSFTSGGALTFTGGAGSTWSTSSGALTLTSAAAATWSTTAGNLTLQAGSGTVSLGTSTNLTASGALTVASGAGTALTLTSPAAATWGTSAGNLTLQAAGAGTTANVQIGAGGAGSATPDVLALDVKSDAGDPAGSNGAMYYNANSNKFRCYENGSWADCIVGGAAPALSSLTAASGANSINNNDYAQTWNWSLTTANKAGITFSENAASVAAGSPAIIKASTLATSTAIPLYITNLGAGSSFRVDDSGGGDTTPFLVDANGNVAIGSTTFDAVNPEKLKVEAGTTSSYNVIKGAGDIDSSLNLSMQNRNAGANAMSVVAAIADNGDATINTVALGITSSGFNDPVNYGIAGPEDAFLVTLGGDLIVGTAIPASSVKFISGGGMGTTAEKMTLNGSGNLGIGNTGPTYLLDVDGPIRSGSDGTDGQLRIYSEQGGADYEVIFNPNAAMTQNTTYTLPANDGDAGQVLSTDGSGGLSWSATSIATDSLDFTDFSDTMAVDAATTIDLAGNSLGISDATSGGALSFVTNGAALTLTADAASTWSTSAGALTLISAAAATWGTAAGNLSLQAAGAGTTANIQIGAGGAGSTAPDFMVLDTKSNAGDPAGTKGAMYYNLIADKFRCYEDGAWKDCDTTGGTTTLQTAYNSGATITTAAAVPITFTLTAGDFNASGAGAVSLTPTGASQFTSGGALTLTGGAASTWSTSVGALTITSATAATWGTTAGDLTLQMAGAGTTASVKIGAGGAGSATPDILGLDVKSDAGDPAGYNGAMYYNENSDTFRCYQNSAWKDCDTTGAIVADSLDFTDFSDTMAVDAATNIDLAGNSLGISDATSGGALSFVTNGAALTLTADAASTWSTSTGALTLTSAAAATWGTAAGNLSLQAAGAGTTANIQIGAGGAGSATPDLLALDVKSDAGDPAGTNGAMYYNANSNKFRCYINGSWGDCDTTGGTVTLQSAYNSGATITTAGAVPIAYTLTAGNFNVSGAGAVSLTPTGASQFTSGAALTLTAGAASIWSTSAGNLDIDSAAALNLGTTNATSVSIGKTATNSTVNGHLLVNDNVTLGSSSADNVTFNGYVASDIIPNVSADRNLGSDANRWKHVYVKGGSLHIGDSGADVTLGYNSTNEVLTMDKSIGIASLGTAPTVPANGTIYYDSGTNKFRCYENGAWKDCGADDSKIAKSIGTAKGDLIAYTASATPARLPVAGVDNRVLSSATGQATGMQWSDIATISPDAFDFSELKDSMTVDASTTIGLGNNNLSITTAGSGALTLTAGAASSLTTTAGALTLTGAAASTWGTSAGNLTLQMAGAGTTANIQIGAGGAGSATPDILGLDVKSDAGDPAGYNGAMYYNSNANKFRCYENGAWKDCDTSGATSLQTAYNGGATITTAGATDIALTLTSGNFTASGAGAVNLTPTSASSFTSGADLTLTAGAASTWGTSSGNLTLQTAGAGTTASVKVGVGGAGSITPDLLALDVKSDAGDPAGYNGAMYYNANTSRFRCYEAGTWVDCGTNAPSTTSLQDAYGNGATITTAGNTAIAYTLTAGNFNASGAGAVNLTPTSASQFTSGAALTLTGGAASTWSTSAGALTITSAAASTWGTSAGNLNLQVAGAGTTANVQIGSGAGSGTPDLLVSDIKNTAGDPAGTNGAIYYNSNANKFRCYENGAWKDCDTSGSVAADSLDFTEFSDSMTVDATTTINTTNSLELTGAAAGLVFGNNTATADDGYLLNLSSINMSSTTEGLKLGQATDCSAATAEGQICWDTDNDILYVGDGTVSKSVRPKVIVEQDLVQKTHTANLAYTTVDTYTTPSLPIGKYKIDYSSMLSSNNTKEIAGKLLMNVAGAGNTTIAMTDVKPKVAGDGIMMSGADYVDMGSSGTIVFTLQVIGYNTGDTVYANRIHYFITEVAQ